MRRCCRLFPLLYAAIAALVALFGALLASQAHFSHQESLRQSAASRGALASALLLRSAPASAWAPSVSDPSALDALDASAGLLPALGASAPVAIASDGTILYSPDRSAIGSAAPARSESIPGLPFWPWPESGAPERLADIATPFPSAFPVSGSIFVTQDISEEWARARSAYAEALLSLGLLFVASSLLLVLPLLLANRKLSEAAETLLNTASLDPLTGALSREHSLCRLSQEHARAVRGISGSLSVFLVEIDHFHAISLAYGPGSSEAAVLAVSARIFHNARGYDVVGRHRGESEFIVILPCACPADARLVADRLRLSICDHPIPFDDVSLRATVSIGLASFRKEAPDETASDLLSRAKQALQAAKDRGGDASVSL